MPETILYPEEVDQRLRWLARIFHEPSAARPQVFLWPRPTAQFDPQRIDNTLPVELLVFLAREPLATARDEIHEICGLEDEKPVLRFLERHKGLILNKTNAMVLSAAFGDETENWTGRDVLLYATTTQFQGRATPCLRIRIPSNEQPAGVDEVPF